MRDIENDKIAGKNTLVVKLGSENAKVYHYGLIISAFLLLILFGNQLLFSLPQYSFALVFIILFNHLKTVNKNKIPKELDSELKKVALSTFLISMILAVSLVILS
jgi:1,4-dihydroxy-2-naphthoate octaprenyltransferase